MPNDFLPQARRRPPFARRSAVSDYAKQIADVIQRESFDVVHVHNFAQLVPLIKSKSPRTKVNLHMQCEWLVQVDHALIAEGVDASDWLSGCSEYIAAGIRRRFPDREKDVFALLNGVDTELFVPGTAHATQSEAAQILFIGRVSPEKGVHVLLQAFNEVVRVEPNVRLKIIGARSGAPYDYICRLDDDPFVRAMASYFRDDASYQRFIDSIPTPEARERVSFVSELPQADLLGAYQDSSVFVFPSVWHEPFGMPIIEAMACGKPVVSTYSGGIPEFVAEDVNGLLVDRGDASALAEALITLVRDPSTRLRMGQNGREFVENELSWKLVSDRLLKRLSS